MIWPQDSPHQSCLSCNVSCASYGVSFCLCVSVCAQSGFHSHWLLTSVLKLNFVGLTYLRSVSVLFFVLLVFVFLRVMLVVLVMFFGWRLAAAYLITVSAFTMIILWVRLHLLNLAEQGHLTLSWWSSVDFIWGPESGLWRGSTMFWMFRILHWTFGFVKSSKKLFCSCYRFGAH
jgi:hypothetical protein